MRECPTGDSLGVAGVSMEPTSRGADGTLTSTTRRPATPVRDVGPATGDRHIVAGAWRVHEPDLDRCRRSSDVDHTEVPVSVEDVASFGHVHVTARHRELHQPFQLPTEATSAGEVGVRTSITPRLLKQVNSPQ